MPTIAEQILSAPAAGLDRFVAASNAFLNRVNLEFGTGESLTRSHVAEMLAAWEDLPVTLSAAKPAYQRTLLFGSAGGHYSVALIRWPAGSRTPVHTHYTWCTFLVGVGILTERRYSLQPGAQGDPLRQETTVSLGRGAFRCDERFGGVHQLSNDTDTDAFSLHCYGVSAAQAATHVNKVFELEGAL